MGTNIGWSFVYVCPSADSSCAPYVEYSAVPAFAYTDAAGNRTPFANWVRDVALPGLKAKNLSFLRFFFSPGIDVACYGCGHSGAAVFRRPYLLTRGNPYVNGMSFATRSQPQMQPWVYSNMKLFFQDVAAAGFELDLTLLYDENYHYWASNPGEGGFVGYDAVREAWLNAATALVDSGVRVLQIEPAQEQQFFQTSPENHPVSNDFTPGTMPTHVLPAGTWGGKQQGQYAIEVADATVGALQQKFPQLAGRIYPGVEMRSATGDCNVQTLNGWGDGPWNTTDVQSYFNWAASRNLVLPWTLNVHRYASVDLNSNFAETADQVRQSFNDLYAFASGDTAAAATRCSSQAVSPQPFSSAPILIFGETNSDAVIDWAGLNLMSGGFQQSRMAQWQGGAYQQTILMPWFFGHGDDPFDPENAISNIHTQSAPAPTQPAPAVTQSRPRAARLRPAAARTTPAADPAPALDLSKNFLRFATSPGSIPLPQTFKIVNRGGGTLSPAVTVNTGAPWLRAVLSGLNGTISVDATGLAAGTYTGTITVTDPVAADSPRLITVIFYVTAAGGAEGSKPLVITEPTRLDFFLPPGASVFKDVFLPVQSVASGMLPGFASHTQNGGNWLTLTLLAESGFFLRTAVTAPATEGVYTGSIDFNDHGRAAGSMPITVTVTSKAILAVDRAQLQEETSPGLEVPDEYLNISNQGSGALTWSALSNVPWMAATQQGNLLRVIFSAATLSPGHYSGNITVTAAGAANGPLVIPVDLQVFTRGVPLLKAGGAVDAANYCSREWCYLAPGSLATLFGSQLAYAIAGATSVPLPTKLGTTRVLVNGAPAELVYVSYRQVNFRLPDALPGGGRWFITVERDGQSGNVITAPATASAPAIFTANQSGAGQGAVLLAGTGQVADSAHPVARGGYLEIYATGLGSGASPTVLLYGPGVVGNIEVTAAYAGPAPGFPGLNQINVQVPQALAAGDRMRIQIRTAANLLSNTVEFAVK